MNGSKGGDVEMRRDEVIKRMLATPPKPHGPSKAKKKGREPKPTPKGREE